ncbi:hypothetical protein BHE74_00051170 [Ensete ventricosum]|nr:hypothetical protein BHE74_00051170 [Ensete ventricosum]
MASEDLIDAKLEAFESRMEDKLRAFCDHRCKRGRLLIEPIDDSEHEEEDLEHEEEDQEIIADFFLLPLDDYEAVLDIEWLTTLGDVF